MTDFEDGVSKLSQGAFQALCCFLQLALEGVYLFRNVIQFFFRYRTGFRHFLNFAIRFAHCAPNFHCDLSELTFFGHGVLRSECRHPIPNDSRSH